VARVVLPMLRARRLLFAIPALAILSLAAGCGGGGKQQVSAAELAQKADQACRQEQTRFRQIQARPPANASEASDQTKALVQAAEDASSAISDLEPPAELRTKFDTYLSARNRAVDQLKKGQDAADNQDQRAYGAAQAAITKGSPQRKKLAGDLGFKVCSRNAGAA
jgi:outer membrane biogenesis lipoprotein LolB